MKSFPLLLAILSLAIPAGNAEAAKPNIVLVMADDQGWGDMACNGHPKAVTPNFDEAAATGLRFNRFSTDRFPGHAARINEDWKPG